MIRKIIKIDEEKCTGCGICANACHEGAIEIVDGKAKLAREHFCDGFGDCLSGCPTGAISFEEREAPAYDEKAVLAAKEDSRKLAVGCPGTRVQVMAKPLPVLGTERPGMPSQLTNWPVQIKLAPLMAPYFQGASLLVAADCTAFSYGAFHQEFLAGRVALIGCPKLDAVDYSEKLTEILRNNDIADVTVARMEVPCCGGLERAVKKAIQDCGKPLPIRVVTIGIHGNILV